jgi:hypothetical protein
MSPNRRLTVLVAAILVVGLGALVALYVPLRKAGGQQRQEAEAKAEAEESRWPDAAELELFLQAREAMMPVYEEYRVDLEKAIDPTIHVKHVRFMRVSIGLRQMIDVMMAALVSRDMSVERFRELSDLIYLRWWRATGPGPAPEIALAENIERYLEEQEPPKMDYTGQAAEVGRPLPGSERDRAAKQRQLEAMRAIVEASRAPALEAVPDETRVLLEANRERIAAADMGLVDSNYLVLDRPGDAARGASGISSVPGAGEASPVE